MTSQAGWDVLKTRESLPTYERYLLDISKVLLAAKHLPEPRGNRCCGNLGHDEVPLLPSLHVRPDGAGESSTPSLILLDILFSMFFPLLYSAVLSCMAIGEHNPKNRLSAMQRHTA